MAGVLWLAAGCLGDGRAYDAMLDAVFLGFVYSMVFAHTPVIMPAMLRVRFGFHPVFYLPLGLLHASLALRLLGGDASGNSLAWQTGGVLNEVAILLFLSQRPRSLSSE
ncbi:membrane protein [Kutzneria sp. 744]|nr:membrane protein [Kutzneria sp. 744]